MKIRYGGKLEFGDVIMIAESGRCHLAYYIGEGIGTLQYIYMSGMANIYNYYLDWQKGMKEDVPVYYRFRFEKHGFSMKTLWKGYIYGDGVGVNGTRVIKIENPDSVITHPDDKEIYLISKEAINHIKTNKK
ncbi:MAG: hypothetical protein EBZ47_09200 [Chlamydiae bacterium]|nr:hypothetical protein [Chlamydiota bacterium]